MAHTSPRLAVRAVILHENRLLLVNAWPEGQSDLWCAPGGGAERGQSLPDNLMREVYEETGLRISVGAPCLVNEFHDPASTFHQVDVYFRCTITAGALTDAWQDPEGIVTRRRFFTRAELSAIRLKPDTLPEIAFQAPGAVSYDPLEPIIR
ncbi:MAG: NUDIX hydrolase [Confluentimicrobium sp.]|jgi:8-oxo-dGTP diphosphatase|uniref:NUDIX domain-containing protein n=1 Tax=Actibacterium sp. TaxID=1872125 RepID=UPI000C5BEC1C|nr:NUDIX hydrolase [Actibacterium sp.]MBC56380.1 NUDIX hydrolase [Actibacterium sp.]|tara:strand:- start:2660 stop:3112 length:453 start_codon:yes stop_codon:yes gene_type:complete